MGCILARSAILAGIRELPCDLTLQMSIATILNAVFCAHFDRSKT